ncbi:MAG: 4-hydroxy-3-methylbut-2-enyl diphosphate reductase [Desulfovibrionaceae bacterium]|nr:4-hydroxy-3-methylbut-2-enyl diphosphate reductase [Desulfovibrionaceae bacterium]
MQTLRAKTGGFCMGVGLAMRKLDETLQKIRSGSISGRLVMYGPIIHNPQVLREYSNQGVILAHSPDDILPGDNVVIRAHGIPCTDEIRLQSLGAILQDATCPRVKQAQLAIADATRDGKPLYLFGEASHPEVRGLISYANGAYRIFSDLDGLMSCYLPEDQHIVLAAQTTQERTVFDEMRIWLQKRAEVTVLSTICDATRRRQQETLEMTHQVEAMIVVGGRNSGNTRRLADVAQKGGLPTWLVETPDELEQLPLKKFQLIGITAGASTPKKLIDAVEKTLHDFNSHQDMKK